MSKHHQIKQPSPPRHPGHSLRTLLFGCGMACCLMASGCGSRGPLTLPPGQPPPPLLGAGPTDLPTAAGPMLTRLSTGHDARQAPATTQHQALAYVIAKNTTNALPH